MFLGAQEFRDSGIEMKLNRPSAYPSDLFKSLQEGFDHICQPACLHRQTGVVLAGLVPDNSIQYTLFDDRARIEKMSRIYSTLDLLSEKFGKYDVHHAASLPPKLQALHEAGRGDVPERKTGLFKGENKRQRLGLPVLYVKV